MGFQLLGFTTLREINTLAVTRTHCFRLTQFEENRLKFSAGRMYENTRLMKMRKYKKSKKEERHER
jgi:hypothetical protein